jgi:nicotinate-nucleotide pyrophosphorylase (carboxylating)
MADRSEFPSLPYRRLYEEILLNALKEDLGGAGDITTDAVVPPEERAAASIVARASGRVAGIPIATTAFLLLDSHIEVTILASEGDDVEAGAKLAVIRGSARPILSAERTALNFLGRLCGIATTTRDVVAAIEGSSCRVVCTRKTTPNLRLLEKYAVRVGGGMNHRFGLDDAVLIKDNHLMVAGGITNAVQRARRNVGHMVKIEVEVETLEQLDEALAMGVDAVLLDNMAGDTLVEAVGRARGKALTEASGGITPDNAALIAASGVDMMSLGWITHSAPSLDVSLDFARRL